MCVITTDRPQAGVYLIVLADYLVSQDLAETVVEFDPGAEVVLCRKLEDAVTAVQPVVAIEVAFVGAGPLALAQSSLAQQIAARGGRVVLIGDAAEAEGEAAGFAVLHRPFALQQVLIHLAGVVSR